MEFSKIFVFYVLVATSVSGMELSRLNYTEKRECLRPPQPHREPQRRPHIVYREPFQPQAPHRPLVRPFVARPQIVYGTQLPLVKAQPVLRPPPPLLMREVKPPHLSYRPTRQVQPPPPPLPILLGFNSDFQYGIKTGAKRLYANEGYL